MTREIYTLIINERGEVSMHLADFLALAEELQTFGVDIAIQNESRPGLIIFKLKERARTQ